MYKYSAIPSLLRRCLLMLVACCVSALAAAQSIQVSDFHFDELDTDANTAGTAFEDPNNGGKCALLKVHTTQQGFTFDVGSLGVAKVEPQGGSHPTQIWVYVPQGVKRLSIMHPQLGELLDYDLGMTLKSARTYHLTLQTGTVQTVINPTLQKQFAVFTLVPANASLEVDGEAWEVNAQGQAARQLPFGTYQYRATAPRYKPSSGQFTVGKEKHTETITLTPNFSTITFQAPAGAEVWVDGQRRGTGTCSVDLSVGEYQVECRQESHLATSKVVTVGANQPRTIQLDAPRPIYGLLSVSSTPFGAKVTVDGKAVGETPLSLDNVLIGQRRVAVSLDGYTAPAAKTVLVSQEQAAAVDFQLEKQVAATAPTPAAATPQNDVSSETITVNGVSFKMIRVEGKGTPFYIGETEVTQALWLAVMGSNPSSFKGNTRPVEQVSWNDCKDFIGRLNSLTGKNFRLPKEAEWEYAAKGGNKSRGYEYSGSNTLDEVGWYYENSGNSRLNDSDWKYDNLDKNNCRTHDVKTKKPNELGIYDMSGNVWEWCEDLYNSSGSDRVLRGGSWFLSARSCRVSTRYYGSPADRFNNLGLRLAL